MRMTSLQTEIYHYAFLDSDLSMTGFSTGFSVYGILQSRCGAIRRIVPCEVPQTTGPDVW